MGAWVLSVEAILNSSWSSLTLLDSSSKLGVFLGADWFWFSFISMASLFYNIVKETSSDKAVRVFLSKVLMQGFSTVEVLSKFISFSFCFVEYTSNFVNNFQSIFLCLSAKISQATFQMFALIRVIFVSCAFDYAFYAFLCLLGLDSGLSMIGFNIHFHTLNTLPA